MGDNQEEERNAVKTPRNSVIKGRFAAICAVILLAALLSGCAGVRADQGVSTPRSEVTPVRELVAVQGVTPPAPPAANEKSRTPAGKASGASLGAETRSNEGGGVTIQVTPAGTAGDDLVFSAVLNTHSVDLNYDYRALATLRDDQGHTLPAASWEGGSSGHHLTGKLVFSNNPSVTGPSVKWIELELKGIAGVPVRTFRWDIK
jgi:hypothetical protein